MELLGQAINYAYLCKPNVPVTQRLMHCSMQQCIHVT